nr:porin [uncultured Fluviicola sp.]
MKRILLVCLFGLLSLFAHTQIFKKDTTDLTFTGTRMNPYHQEYDTTGKLKISGYIDTYYSYYTDTLGAGGYSKFPTSSPKNNQFGINIVQVSAKYESRRMRGIATLFYGDIPLSAWSQNLNLIQEANVGFRVFKKLWLDAGYFRTHIGLESIQPRENITTSIATTTYFEPYFLSGAKLTWQQSNKWTYQVNVFNGFSTFVETNKNKAIGISIGYAGTQWTHTLSSIVSDEYPSYVKQNHFRHYTNYIGVFKTNHIVLGLEGNFGYQQNSQLSDTNKTAFVFSGIVAFKYRFTHLIAAYTRFELFSDPDEILTGPIENENHNLTGLDILGGTLGFEYKPIPNAYFRIESRVLKTKATERIFYYNNHSNNIRWEGIASIGLWF